MDGSPRTVAAYSPLELFLPKFLYRQDSRECGIGRISVGQELNHRIDGIEPLTWAKRVDRKPFTNGIVDRLDGPRPFALTPQIDALARGAYDGRTVGDRGLSVDSGDGKMARHGISLELLNSIRCVLGIVLAQHHNPPHRLAI